MDKLCNVSRCSCCVCAILQQCSVSTLSLTPWRHFLEEMHFGSRARHWWWWSMWSDSESLAATCSWSDIRTGHHQHCRHHHYQHQHHHHHHCYHHQRHYWEAIFRVWWQCVFMCRAETKNEWSEFSVLRFICRILDPLSQRRTSLVFCDIYSPPFLPILLFWEMPPSSQKWGLCHSFSFSWKAWCFLT